MKKLSTFILTVGIACGQAQAATVKDAVTDQINPAHDGAISFKKGFAPPLKLKWSRDLGGPVSYPVTANGMVFVTVGNPYGSPGTQLFALDIATGSIVWQQAIAGSQYWSNLAADNGQVFVLNNDGLLQAFAADTAGELRWSVQMPYNYAFTGSPTAYNRQVFLCGAGGLGHLYAIDEATGSANWTADVNGGDNSSPALGNGGAYVAFSGRYYRFDAVTGQQDWIREKRYSGGGGFTPVYNRQRVHLWKEVLDAKTGETVARLPTDQQPAFWEDKAGERREIILRRSKLQAVDPDTEAVIWRFRGDGQLTTAPIIVNNAVVIGSKMGEVYVLDAATGVKAWSTNIGSPILPSGPSGAQNRPWTGVGAGEDTLFVPATNLLTAYMQAK